MNEITEPIETKQPGSKRAPVIWQIASVSDEQQSVTVVFPITNDITGMKVNESIMTDQRE